MYISSRIVFRRSSLNIIDLPFLNMNDTMKSYTVNYLICFMILSCIFKGSQQVNPDTQCFPTNSTTKIPPGHLFHRKKIPLVIGHRGDIQTYQENSLDGMTHLIAIAADGIHMQVQLTKDKKLILFGEDNFKRMTGDDFRVDSLPYSEISKMRLKKTISYGNITKIYSKVQKIPLLVDVLDVLKGNGLLIYIELVPSHVPPQNPGDRFKSLETGQEIGRIIQQMRMENEVFVVSYDPFKLVATAYENPHIALGWWVHRDFYRENQAAAIRKEFIDIPGLRDCYVTTAPLVGPKFMEFVVESGIVQKAVNASVLDLDFGIYDKKLYWSNRDIDAIETLRDHYNTNPMPGCFNVFSIETSKNEFENEKEKIIHLVRQGLTRIVTDDVNQVKVTLERVLVGYSARQRSNLLYITFLFMLTIKWIQ